MPIRVDNAESSQHQNYQVQCEIWPSTMGQRYEVIEQLQFVKLWYSQTKLQMFELKKCIKGYLDMNLLIRQNLRFKGFSYINWSDLEQQTKNYTSSKQYMEQFHGLALMCQRIGKTLATMSIKYLWRRCSRESALLTRAVTEREYYSVIMVFSLRSIPTREFKGTDAYQLDI